MAILELKDVSYRYGADKKEVVKHVNVSFEQGTFYVIIGRSGSGKSTLLSLMAGLDLPTEGNVIFDGSTTAQMDLDEYRRKHAAVVYQDFSLFPLLTVLENIMYPMELCRVGKDAMKRDARMLAESVGLPQELWNRFPGKISGGEQQRCAVARALAMDRRLILADEPTGNLDSENSDTIISLLSKLAHEQNRCVITVTHDLFVMEKADQVYRMQDGVLERYR